MANYPTHYGTSPVGRLIMGDPWNKQTKDSNGRDIQPDKQRYFFGLSIEKNAPGVNEMIATMQKAAMEGYAQNPTVMQQAQNINLGPNVPFSWKIQDGDEMIADPQTGQQKLRNQHGAGCWIFKFSTTFPIRASKFPPGSNAPVDCDTSEIRKGFYVMVAYSTSANGNQDHTAGLYLNPQSIALVGYGQEIVSGPSLEQQFSGGPGGYVPQGMTTAPQGPTGAPGQSAPGMQQPAPGMQQPAPGMQQPAPGMQQPAPGGMPNPMNSGAQMPGASMPNGATGSPGSDNATPPAYGGYMQG